jgi:mutator protein MutT
MQNNKNETGVVFVLLNDNSEILMQLRDENSPKYPNTWVFPGGKKDDGEEYIDTVIREVKEEYCITLKKEDCELATIYNIENFVYNNHVYVCHIKGNDIPEINEGATAKWMKIGEIRALKLGYQQEVFLPELIQFLTDNKR